MKILIDGDGSPVKEATIALAKQYQVPVQLVTTFDHYSQKNAAEDVDVIYVDRGADAADYKIVGLVQKGDLVVTQDYGLASLVLAKKARALHQNGQEYLPETIDFLLAQRYESAMIRKAGKHTKGPRAYTENDREQFKQALIQILEELTAK
jgi:Uncharacterized protein conserved in bacteria